MIEVRVDSILLDGFWHLNRPFHPRNLDPALRQHRTRMASQPLVTFEVSQSLREHMRALRPDWPSPDERHEDLVHHIALKQLIDRAAGAFVAATHR
jgi:hypothetical protein